MAGRAPTPTSPEIDRHSRSVCPPVRRACGDTIGDSMTRACLMATPKVLTPAACPRTGATGVFADDCSTSRSAAHQRRRTLAWTIPFQTLEHHISPARLAPYRSATPNDDSAVQLYEWNARMSAALWETIGHVEILVRNAMHQRLTAWSIATFGQPRWYLDPGQVLTPEHLNDVRRARQRATRTRTGVRPETTGRVVAELSFGFWRFLVAKHYTRTLWQPCLHRAFPGKSHRQVHDALRELHLLRNRCAHHEPIHQLPIQQLHTAALEVAGWISVSGRRWVATRSRCARYLAQRP